MTIQVVRQTKTSKTFLRNNFRKVILLIMVSLLLNGLFSFGIYNNMIHRKPPNYYATSGMTPPIKLNARSEPNYTATPLLAPDPFSDDDDTIVTYEQK